MDELKKRQIGALTKGDLFKTIISGRMGVVVELYDLPEAGVRVQLKDPDELKVLHPEIRVYA